MTLYAKMSMPDDVSLKSLSDQVGLFLIEHFKP